MDINNTNQLYDYNNEKAFAHDFLNSPENRNVFVYWTSNKGSS